MRAIVAKRFGGSEVLQFASVPDLLPSPTELLVEVYATALNRADILQRTGKYPPPKGASDILGLEIAGKVVKAGENAGNWQDGDWVFGLIPGGGYAEFAVIHHEMAMKIPSGMTMEEAAAIPEVFLTAYQSLFWLAKLADSEKVLIHAGASGVGTAAIQLAKTKNAVVFVTTTSAKHEACFKLGANYAFDYTTGAFEPWLLEKTENSGVNIIMDFIGSSYFSQNINCLSTDGRLIQLALLGEAKPVMFNLSSLLRKRIQLIGSTLRNRSLSYQIRLTQDFYNFTIEKFKSKEIAPVIGKVFDWHDVQEAHKYMESNKNIGKILLKVKKDE